MEYHSNLKKKKKGILRFAALLWTSGPFSAQQLYLLLTQLRCRGFGWQESLEMNCTPKTVRRKRDMLKPM